MAIYTKTGDRGETSLYGCRLPKDHPLLEAIGSLDELNANLGVVIAGSNDEWLKIELAAIQTELFTLGAELATPVGQNITGLKLLEAADITRLEQMIDKYEHQLPPLKNFILPGGTMVAAELMRARAVARRAERAVIEVTRRQVIRPPVQQYLNRLSDYLFILARYVNYQSGQKEIIWQR